MDLVRVVEGRYRCKPYASARAVVGFGEHAPSQALVPPHVFGWVLVGSPAAAPECDSHRVPKDGGVFLCQGETESEPRKTWAASLFARLRRTQQGEAKKTVVKVDCSTGEQSQQDAVLATATLERLTHDSIPGTSFKEAMEPFAMRAFAWLAAHHEKQKLDSLATMMPWSEFA